MTRHKSSTRVCRRCGEKFRTRSPWAKVCGPCKKAAKRAATMKRVSLAPARPGRKKKEPPKPPKPVAEVERDRLLDREQHRFNMELDNRLYADCVSSPVRVIRPGDPEFEAIAREVTPIERIPEMSTLPIVSMIGREYLPNGGFPLR